MIWAWFKKLFKKFFPGKPQISHVTKTVTMAKLPPPPPFKFESYSQLQEYLEELSYTSGAAKICGKCGLEGKASVFSGLSETDVQCCERNYGHCFCAKKKRKQLGCVYYMCRQLGEKFPELNMYFLYIKKNKRNLGELKRIEDYNKKQEK